jgi:hemerythrin
MSDGDWEWSEELSTAITFLDEEHKDLVQSYLKLMQDVRNATCLSHFLEDLQDLLARTRAHFAHEERVMRNIDYHGLREHKTVHDRLLEDFSDFLQNIGTGFSQGDFHALAEYFRYWLFDHIKDHDVPLKAFIDRTD